MSETYWRREVERALEEVLRGQLGGAAVALKLLLESPRRVPLEDPSSSVVLPR